MADARVQAGEAGRVKQKEPITVTCDGHDYVLKAWLGAGSYSSVFRTDRKPSTGGEAETRVLLVSRDDTQQLAAVWERLNSAVPDGPKRFPGGKLLKRRPKDAVSPELKVAEWRYDTIGGRYRLQAVEWSGRSDAFQHFIDMDHINGENLLTALANSGDSFTLELRRAIFQQLLLALEQLHRHRVTHQDIKLDNAMLVFPEEGEGAPKPRAILVDLGCATVHPDSPVPACFPTDEEACACLVRPAGGPVGGETAGIIADAAVPSNVAIGDGQAISSNVSMGREPTHPDQTAAGGVAAGAAGAAASGGGGGGGAAAAAAAGEVPMELDGPEDNKDFMQVAKSVQAGGLAQQEQPQAGGPVQQEQPRRRGCNFFKPKHLASQFELDVFALGCLFTRLMTGGVAFGAGQPPSGVGYEELSDAAHARGRPGKLHKYFDKLQPPDRAFAAFLLCGGGDGTSPSTTRQALEHEWNTKATVASDASVLAFLRGRQIAAEETAQLERGWVASKMGLASRSAAVSVSGGQETDFEGGLAIPAKLIEDAAGSFWPHFCVPTVWNEALKLVAITLRDDFGLDDKEIADGMDYSNMQIQFNCGCLHVCLMLRARRAEELEGVAVPAGQVRADPSFPLAVVEWCLRDEGPGGAGPPGPAREDVTGRGGEVVRVLASRLGRACALRMSNQLTPQDAMAEELDAFRRVRSPRWPSMG